MDSPQASCKLTLKVVLQEKDSDNDQDTKNESGEQECPVEHLPCLCAWTHAAYLPPYSKIQAVNMPLTHSPNWKITNFQGLLLIDLPLQPPRIL